jgi:hydrogenase maturation protein HypF
MKSVFTEIRLSSFPPRRNAIAFGADSKNTVSTVDKKRRLAASSGNNGPLSDPASAGKFEDAVSEMLKSVKPGILAVDLHPDYYSTVHGEKMAEKLGVPILRVQHHHAHAVSCMAEHGLDEAMALVFDGTGYGTDGNLWGAELLHVNSAGFTRLATFAAAPLPGGDVSVREPLRQLFGRIFFSICHAKPDMDSFCRRYDLNPDIAEVWLQQLEKNINCPSSHSAGRLFDSVSALLGCAPKIAHEAEAAINLQKAAEECKDKPEPSLMPFKTYEKDGMLFIDWSPIFINHSIISSQKKLLALSFHHSLAQAALQMVEFGTAKLATRNIVLSGGVFMNKLLLGILKSKLGKMKVFSHENIPTNDCGVSIGQAVIAASENL